MNETQRWMGRSVHSVSGRARSRVLLYPVAAFLFLTANPHQAGSEEAVHSHSLAASKCYSATSLWEKILGEFGVGNYVSGARSLDCT
jgi:hypothetical protein